MADTRLARVEPLHGLALPSLVGVVTVSAAEPTERFIYRGDPVRVGDLFGVALPTTPLRANEHDGRAALWLGPDEWLLLAPAAAGTTLRAELAGAVRGKPASLVDISHRNTALVIDGPRAADLLASCCPLDLDVSAFPVGMATRTVFAKAEIVLWRRAPKTFRLELQRSFAAYVAGLLNEAARPMAVRT